jgi:protein-S-isoprenylcysteine O-methyltransferase Ste14
MQVLWSIVLTVSGLATASLFARAVRGHFVSQKLPPAMKALMALSYLALFAYLWALWTGEAAQWQRIVGLCLQIAAAGLFNWARTTTLANRITAAFDTDQPAFLVTAGPYRFVRHPFYVSYIVCWAGSSLAANSSILWTFCLVLSASYIAAALMEEKKFKESTLAADYQSYSEKVGFFFPKVLALTLQSWSEDRPVCQENALAQSRRREPRT